MSEHTCDCKNGNCECGGSCGGDSCGGDHGFERRYQTKAEQIAELESYLKDLKSELQAVEEHLADLRK